MNGGGKMIFEKKENQTLWKFMEDESNAGHLRFFNKQSFNEGGYQNEYS